MGFRWLNKQNVESDEGYGLRSAGRFAFEYREGEWRITISREPGIDPATCPSGAELVASPEVLLDPSRAVSLSLVDFPIPLRWDPPHAGELIDGAKRRQIIDNFDKAMKFMGLRWVSGEHGQGEIKMSSASVEDPRRQGKMPMPTAEGIARQERLRRSGIEKAKADRERFERKQ